MYILGIGGYTWDAAAVIIKDGKLIAAAEEERYTRKKHETGMPYKAIEYCLKEAKVSLEDIDYIGFSYSPWLRITKRIPYRIIRLFSSPVYSTGYILDELFSIGKFLVELNKLKGKKTKIVFVEHHLAHAGSAFLVSPFEESAILTVDYMGEWASTVFAKGEGSRIQKIKEINYPHSLGVFYAALTNHLGFEHGNDEYKVMGLASYGEPSYADLFYKMIKLKPKGEFEIDLSYFTYASKAGSYEGFMSKKFIDICGPKRKKDEEIAKKHKDIAASLQNALEKAILHILTYLHEIAPSKNLCISGGVGLNCVMNSRIIKDSAFKNLFIQPSPHDAGTALGNAFYIYNTILGESRKFTMKHAYWGNGYLENEIKAELELCKLSYEYHSDITKVAAALIADGKILAWFQGRMEWGPRALGNRSILADPTRKDMQDIINKYVKHREDFRPFAPAVLKEKAQDYFDFKEESPFMLFISDVKKDKREVIPAVTHVDGTARLQTVTKEENPLFYKLIEEFYKIKGVPVVLNTSLNVKGEPIVCTPKEAIRCFYSTGLDYLVIGNFLLKK